MIPNEKYVEIAKGLLEKTKKQKAIWKPFGMTVQEREKQMGQRMVVYPSREVEATEFVLQLDNSVVRLGFTSPPTEVDMVTLRLLDKQEHLAGSWTVEEGDQNWPLAFELYQEVSKQVNKWDKILEEVEAFIGKP